MEVYNAYDRVKEGKTVQLMLFILIGLVSRIIPHPANMTAVGTVSLFAGMKMKGKFSFIVPLITMFLSDMILGFHSVMWATYSSLLVGVLLGKLVRRHQSFARVMGATFASSLVFFFVTNFAVWLDGSLYPKTFSGLIECFIMALPFFRNSLIGDIGYSAVFVVAYELIKRFKVVLMEKYHARVYV